MYMFTNVNTTEVSDLNNVIDLHNIHFDQIDSDLSNVQRQLNILSAKATAVKGLNRFKVAMPPFFDREKESVKVEKWKQLIELYNKLQSVTTNA